MRGFAARLACRAIREYQLVRAGRPPTCRYAPSCSAYALEAVQTHGAMRGVWLAARRLVRCHPWGSTGWDPVPTAHALRGRADRRANPVHTGEAVARAARERSEQERETPRRDATGRHLSALALRKTDDV